MASLEPHHCHVLRGLARVFSHEALACSELRLRDGVERAHPALLAALSPVLQDRLAGDDTSCSLSEMSVDTWRSVVQFLCGGTEVAVNQVVEVREAATLLELCELENHCQQRQESAAQPGPGDRMDPIDKAAALWILKEKERYLQQLQTDQPNPGHFRGEGSASSDEDDFVQDWKVSHDLNLHKDDVYLTSGVVSEDFTLYENSRCTKECCDPADSAESGGGGRRLLSTLLRCQEEGKFCDYELQLKDGAVAAIGPMLVALSDFFFAILTLEMSEHQSKVVRLPCTSRADWQCITSFYFGSGKLVTEDNAMDLIEVSEMYQLHHLKEHCGLLLLSSKMHMDDFVALYRAFQTHNMPRSLGLLAGRFSELCKSSAFLELTQVELLELLQNVELVVCEDKLCERLLQWLEVHEADTATATALLSRLMLHCLSGLCLSTDLLPSSFVQGNVALETPVREELRRRHKFLYVNSYEEEPVRRGWHRSAYDIVVVGYKSSEFLLYSWCQEMKTWIQHPGPSVPVQEGFASAVVRDCLFVTGGRGSADTHILDLVQKAWRSGPALASARYKHAMAVVDNVPYVVGGKGKGALEVEAYSEADCAWREVGKLRGKRGKCTAAAIGEIISVSRGGGRYPVTIQGFNVRTGEAATVQLRQRYYSPPILAAAAHSGDALFLHADGDVRKVSRYVSPKLITSNVMIPSTGRALISSGSGLYVDWGWLLVVGGTCRRDIQCLCLCKKQFRPHECTPPDFADLPQCLTVTGVYNLRLSAP